MCTNQRPLNRIPSMPATSQEQPYSEVAESGCSMALLIHCGHPRGDLTVRWRTSWRSHAPNVQIEVHLARTAHLLQALKPGEIEISFVATPGGTVDPAQPSVRLRTSPRVRMAASEYVHDPLQPVPLILPNEPSGYRATALATLDAHRISWRIRHASTSLAFSGVRAAVHAGLGIMVRTIEMLYSALRVLSESEGLPRLPNIGHNLYLRHERVSPPAQTAV